MTTATLTITDFLLARISEDEQAARTCMGERSERGVGYRNGSALDMDSDLIGTDDGVIFISPVRVLAECEAKRRIVAAHPLLPFIVGDQAGQEAVGNCLVCQEPVTYRDAAGREVQVAEVFPCPTLRHLALPYADHENYNPDWA